MERHAAMLVVTEKSLLNSLRFEAVRQLVQAAQRRGMPAVDLVRGDAQALPGGAAKATSGNRRSSRQIRTRVGASASTSRFWVNVCASGPGPAR